MWKRTYLLTAGLMTSTSFFSMYVSVRLFLTTFSTICVDSSCCDNESTFIVWYRGTERAPKNRELKKKKNALHVAANLNIVHDATYTSHAQRRNYLL